MSFPLDAGLPGYASTPAVAKEFLGASKVVAIYADNAATESASDAYVSGAKLAGIDIVKDIRIPMDAIDYSIYVRAAEDAGADAIITPLAATQVLKRWGAIDSAGSDLRLVASTGSITPAMLAEAGAVAEGDFVATTTPNADESSETGQQYLAEMAKFAPEETSFTGVGLRAWAAVHLFAETARTIDGDVDRESLLEAIKGVNDVEFMWLESLSFDKDGPVADTPRLPNYVTFPLEIKDGTFVSLPSFDPFS